MGENHDSERAVTLRSRPVCFVLGSVGQRVKLSRHHPELVRKQRVMGIGHLAKALSTIPQELNLPPPRHVLSQSV